MKYTFESSPVYINAWVYGDGSGNDLYMRFATSDGYQSVKMCALSFTGYQLIKTAVPSGATGISALAVVRADSGALSGTIYVDQLMEAFKSMSDTAPPSVSVSAASISSGKISLSAVVSDADTTVKAEGITVALDGEECTFTYNEDTGSLSASMTVADISVTHKTYGNGDGCMREPEQELKGA
jgi:hypothetical protein